MPLKKHYDMQLFQNIENCQRILTNNQRQKLDILRLLGQQELGERFVSLV
jgi:hypothetical protein